MMPSIGRSSSTVQISSLKFAVGLMTLSSRVLSKNELIRSIENGYCPRRFSDSIPLMTDRSMLIMLETLTPSVSLNSLAAKNLDTASVFF